VYCGEFSGSGFMLDPSAVGASGIGSVIVTNHHVVDTCLDGSIPEVSINGSAVSARVLDFDVPNDLAILSADIDVPPLQASTSPAAGEWVMAIGNPLGVDGTVTFGTVTNLLPDEAWITPATLVDHDCRHDEKETPNTRRDSFARSLAPTHGLDISTHVSMQEYCCCEIALGFEPVQTQPPREQDEIQPYDYREVLESILDPLQPQRSLATLSTATGCNRGR
jgi:hypothetical protein